MMEKITDPLRWFLGRWNRGGRGMRCVRCACVADTRHNSKTYRDL